MKIAIIGADRNDSMERHLRDAFNHLLHEAKIFDLKKNKILNNFSTLNSVKTAIDKITTTYSDRYDSKQWLGLYKSVYNFGPDLVVAVYKHIHPTLVKKIRERGIKIIHINPDSFFTLGYQQIFAADYNAWFVKDPYMYRFMTGNMGLNTFLYKEAFNHRFNPKPDVRKSVMEDKYGIEISTYGTVYPYRGRILKQIKNAGLDLKIYGVKPHRFFDKELSDNFTNQYITGTQKAEILYGSKIVINTLHFAEIESVNCRFFEINGCGAFQLCDYRPVLNELLPVNPDLVSYKNTKEGIDKMKYYLRHPEERYEISDVIYNHFVNNYTYDHLIKHVLDISENI